MKELYPESVYVIPNLRDMEKPCNPIAITRGLDLILQKLNIPKERDIQPSTLYETFINLLLDCDNKPEAIDLLCGYSKSNNEQPLSSNISAMVNLMIKLKELDSNPAIGTMKWYNLQ
jgi:hypothetical protein